MAGFAENFHDIEIYDDGGEEGTTEEENSFKLLTKNKDYAGLIQEMKNNKHSMRSQKYGCKAISILASKTEGIENLVKVGACQMILTAMRAFPSAPDVQRHASDAIMKLANAEENRRLFGEIGACEALVDGLKACRSSVNTIKCICVAVGQLAYKNNPNKSKFGQADACQTLVEIINEFSHERAILVNAYNLVTSFALDPVNDNMFWSANIADALINSLDNYQNDLEVQYLGIRAIFELVMSLPSPEGSSESKNSNNDSRKSKSRSPKKQLNSDEESKQCSVGLCKVVIDAMNIFPNEEDLQMICLKTIRQLSHVHGMNKVYFHQNGACQSVVNVLQRFTSHKQINHYAFWAIMNLSCEPGGEENRIQLRSLNICSYIIRAMREFRNEVDIQFYGIRALINLMYSANREEEDNRANIPEDDIIAIVNAAMENFPYEQRIQCRGCWLLYHLCQDNGKNKSTLFEIGTCLTVSQALQNFPDDEDVHYHACTVVCEMAKDREDIAQGFKDLNVEELIVESMRTHNFDLKVKGWSRKALDALMKKT